MIDGKCRVLVVDDDSSVLFTYKLLLQREGYDTTAVLSSEEAKKQLAEREFDVLLCDLSLEAKHTGFEVIEFGRQQQPRLACVMLTGYATADAADAAQQMGVPVLYKPIEINEFLTTIPTVLKSKYEQAETGSR